MSERPNGITASMLSRVIACPKSYTLERMFENEDTEYSNEGTRKHEDMSIWARSYFLNDGSCLLTDEEDICYCERAIRKLAEENADEWIKGFFLIEKRLYEENVSGQIDFAAISGSKAWVVDYKFGVMSVEEATANPQLMAYALLIFENYAAVEEVNVRIIQPNALGRKETTAIYSRLQLNAIKDGVKRVVDMANSENAPYAEKIGGHCQFCRAKSVCEKQKQNLLQVADANEVKAVEFLEITTDNCVKVFDEVQRFKAKLNQAKKLVDIAELKLEKFASENTGAGLEFKQGAMRFTLTDIRTFVGEFMAKLGASYDDLLPTFKLEKSKLDEVAKAKGVKGSELKDFYTGLNGCEFAQGKPKLVKAK